ncbi:LOW QUALITY PROTEIN: N-acetylgalactosaminyltransferase 7-like [Ruditapes philippinarum]|uniref:LOW QUALITY PROTEIN: N-acetylgalactosaminyltransferase 7-like n=1 Tax=Ruditapes philippinarum TaxID=129788 RepID=UPI00295B6909|nr:LOW QUALITY PROTEIN: N-acetylgalactosaminyltransferase 7-like [Ruditapes philippinarum]
MRLRFRKSLLIKLGVLTLVLLFTIPYFVSKLDDTSRQESLKYRAWNKLANDVKEMLPFNDPKKNVIANPLELPGSANDSSVHKVYGPKSIFRSGVLGNYEPDYKIKHGPGEGGQPVFTTMEEKSAADRSTHEFGFNMVNSDKISLDRTIPDTRMDECKYWQYPEISKLPSASVILVFHNEGWSTLIRTVHSVVNMSPPELLKEVVMVDDFSDKEHLKGKLEDYINEYNKKHNNVVKLFRNSERLGLIGTRTRGAELSTADVIVFLDAHCECNRNWLVPLLSRIAYDRTIMTVPIVDGINWDNYAYASVYGAATAHHRGIFEWGFLYKESQVPLKELRRREHNSEPYRAPTHAGGLFAIDRKYFFEMGAYDEGLQIWGGENFELSFKIWQCGGSIEWVPCSRVGHVYRNHMPYGFGKIDHKIPVILLNYMRVVEVWLDDEFKEYFYTREPSVRGYPIGDVSKQLKFKKDKNCKSFKWFMDNIAYEVYDKFPILPPNKAWGEVKQKKGYAVLGTLGQSVGAALIGVSHCHHFGGNQMYRLNVKGQIGVGERCIEAPSGDTLHMSFCDTQPVGPWEWDEHTGLMKHTNYGKCVEAGGDNKLHLVRCDPAKSSQSWTINEIKTWQR